MNYVEKSKYKRIPWLIVFLTLLTLACGISFPLASQIINTPPPEQIDVATVPAPINLTAPISEGQSVLTQLYAQVNQAVVNLTIYGEQAGQVIALTQGSGFVYDNQGYIVTNAHVVQDAKQIDVTFSDDTVVAGTLIGLDLNSDLAVVKVDQLPSGVQSLSLGDMADLQVGQTVVAIGNPFGLQGTLTEGIISALGRTIPALTPFSIPQAIQTDAAINPGNSGGPLLNLQGEVIGVNAQIETGGVTRSNSGVGFAIPVNIVKRVVPDLIQNGSTEWSWLGVRGGSLTPVIVKAMDLPVERGAYIAEVTPNGPAEGAGLQGADETATVDGRPALVGGDVITAINGQVVGSFDDLLIYIALETRPDQEVTLTIVREGKNQEVKVKLASRPETLDSLSN